MERRNFITLVASTSAVALLGVACGSDDDGAPLDTVGDTLPPVVDSVPATDAPADGDDAEDADAEVGVVLEYGNYGGFTTREISFQMQPNVYVTTDNRVILPGAMTLQFPGPMIPPMFQRSITDEGVATMLDAAVDAGLDAEVDYSAEINVADAATATLRFTVDGTTHTHEAYALGIAGPPGAEEQSPERAALADYLAELGDLEQLVGADQLGPEEPYVADAYQIRVQPMEVDTAGDPAPRVVAWPDDTGLRLADAAGCVELPASAVGDLFADADQLTFFEEAGITYSIVARPALPGRTC